MLIEYDLVILGATELGCQMALRARQLGARVALVEQAERPKGSIAFRQWLQQTQSQQTQSQQTQSQQAQSQQTVPVALDFEVQADDHKTAQLAAIDLEDQLRSFSPKALQLQGVDYLAQSGYWVKRPKPGFQVGDRLLRSSAFFATIASKRQVPLALHSVLCLQPEDFPLQTALPDRVAIVGEAIVGVELALALASLDVEVTLIVPTPQILPQMPMAGAFRIQGLLETAGIQVMTGIRVRSAKQESKGQIQLQLPHQSITVDAVILATALEPLKADRLGVRSVRRSAQWVGLGAEVMGLGRDGFDPLTSNGAAIAWAEVDRILMPWKSARQNTRSRMVGQLTLLPTVWVGSAGKFGDRLHTMTGLSPDKQLWYHLCVTDRGKLVNGTLVGAGAEPFGPLLSWLEQTRANWSDLATLPLSDPSQSQLIHQWLMDWEMLNRSRHPLLHELFLDWLTFRRRRSG